MKAIVCEKFGLPDTLVVKDIPSVSPGQGEVKIIVKACGINFPDGLIIQGLYQIKPPLPFVPGSDVAGIIEEVGDGISNFTPGDKVFGFVEHGGYAEETIIKAKACFPIPEGMDFITAASFMVAYGTAYHALKDRAHLKTKETLLVLGASGGVGLAALQLGKLMGANVVAAASTDAKLALCNKNGADHLINYQSEDLKSKVKEITNGLGADVVFDPVGGPYSEPALRATAWNGRYLVIGFAAGDIPKISLNIPLLKGNAVVGVFWGRFAQQTPKHNLQNIVELVQWFKQGKLTPHIDKVYKLEEAPQALNAILNRRSMGKLVIKMG